MSRVELEFCPICGIQMEPKDLLGRSRDRHAVVVTIGGSKGGWGQRFDRVDFKDEVCEQCGDAIWARMSAAWFSTMVDLKDSRQAVVVSVAHDGEVKTQMPKRGLWARIFGE